MDDVRGNKNKYVWTILNHIFPDFHLSSSILNHTSQTDSRVKWSRNFQIPEKLLQNRPNAFIFISAHIIHIFMTRFKILEPCSKNEGCKKNPKRLPTCQISINFEPVAMYRKSENRIKNDVIWRYFIDGSWEHYQFSLRMLLNARISVGFDLLIIFSIFWNISN